MLYLDVIMEYMVRFMQTHESFRLAEIQALATLENIDLKIVSYDPTVGNVLVKNQESRF